MPSKRKHGRRKSHWPTPRIYHPQYPEKYKGTLPIVIRSSLEARTFRKLDTSDSIITWGSESVVIPYVSPLDGMKHRYFPDIIALVKVDEETTKTLLIEIKPAGQCVQPKRGRKRERTYRNELKVYLVNSAKWEAAKKWCDSQATPTKQVEFRLLTENDL